MKFTWIALPVLLNLHTIKVITSERFVKCVYVLAHMVGSLLRAYQLIGKENEKVW